MSHVVDSSPLTKLASIQRLHTADKAAENGCHHMAPRSMLNITVLPYSVAWAHRCEFYV